MSDNSDSNRKYKLTIEVDKAAAQQTAAIMQAHIADTSRLTQAYNTLQAASENSVGGISDNLDSATTAVKENELAVTRLREEYIKAADAAEALKDAEGSASGGGSISQLGTLERTGGRVLSMVGLHDIAQPLQMMSALSRGISQLGAIAETSEGGVIGLVTSFGPLLPILAAAAIAFAAVKFAMGEIEKQSEATKKAIEAETAARQEAIDRQLKIEKGIETKSPEQLKQEMKDATREVELRSAASVKAAQELADARKEQVGDGPIGLDPIGLAKQAIAIKLHNDKINDLTEAYNVAGTAADKASKALQDLQAQQDGVTSRSGIEKILQKAADLNKTLGEDWTKFLEGAAQAAHQMAVEEQKAADARVKKFNQSLNEGERVFGEYTSALDRLHAAQQAVSDMEKARAQQISDEIQNDARTTFRGAVEKEYADKIAAAKRIESEQAVRDQLLKQNTEAETKRNEDIGKIDQSLFDAETKAWDNYAEAEKSATDKYNLERKRALASAQTDLKSLAAEGDVAAFVQRSKQAKDQLSTLAENHDLEEQARQKQLNKELDMAEQAHTKQLQDLEANYEKEKAAREQAAQDQIASIEKTGQEANSKSAELERELNDLREQWRRDDLTRQRDAEEQSYEDRLTLQKAKQAEMLIEATNFYNDWINIVKNTGVSSDPNNSGDQGYNAPVTGFSESQQPYAIGLPYVPREGFYHLDKGEGILNEKANREYSSGRSKQSIHVEINNTVGNIATKDDLDEYQAVTTEGIRNAWSLNRGRS